MVTSSSRRTVTVTVTGSEMVRDPHTTIETVPTITGPETTVRSAATITIAHADTSLTNVRLISSKYISSFLSKRHSLYSQVAQVSFVLI